MILRAGPSDEDDPIVCVEIGDEPMIVFVDLTIDQAEVWINRLVEATQRARKRRAIKDIL